jgi:hypothetical protein
MLLSPVTQYLRGIPQLIRVKPSVENTEGEVLAAVELSVTREGRVPEILLGRE